MLVEIEMAPMDIVLIVHSIHGHIYLIKMKNRIKYLATFAMPINLVKKVNLLCMEPLCIFQAKITNVW